MKEEIRSSLISIAIAVSLFWGFSKLFGSKEVPMETMPEKVILKVEDALQLSQRVEIENEDIKGSINRETGEIDTLTLRNFKETVEDDSPNVSLLYPQNTKNMCVLHPMVRNLDGEEQKPWEEVPTEQRSIVKLEKKENQLLIQRTYQLLPDFTIAVEDEVTNLAETVQKVRFSQEIRQSTGNTILHEGGYGFLQKRLQHFYDLKKKGPQRCETKGGWIGFHDKYWFAGFLLPESQEAEFTAQEKEGISILSLAFPATILKPQQKVKQTYIMFTGVKRMDVLERVAETHQIPRLNLAVDFGMLYFLTIPIFTFLNWIFSWTKNFGVAILILTTLSKLLLLPLSIKSYRAILKMKKINPMLERLKSIYGDDKIRLNQEVLALYQRERVKPMGGCLPLLIQLPIFFCLYKVLTINVEMRHAAFFGWIQDLSMPDPTSFLNLFGLLPFEPPAVFSIGLLPIIMGLSMFLQQKLTPQSYADPAQEKAMMFMPLFFTYIFASFPAGLVIYWTWSNIISILQQLWMNRYLKV